MRDLGIPETKLQNALLEVWNKTDLIASETSSQDHPLEPDADSFLSSSNNPGSTPAALHQPAADQARPDSLPLPHPPSQTKAASHSGTTQHASPLESHSGALEDELQADPVDSALHSQSAQGQQLGTDSAVSQQQQHPGSISNDRHRDTGTVKSEDAAAGQPMESRHQHHAQQQALPPSQAVATDQTSHGDRQMSHHDSQQAQQQSTFPPHGAAGMQQHGHDNRMQPANSASHADHAVSSHWRVSEVARPGAVQQGSGKPLALFTSAVTGQGLPELLLEVERKVCISCRPLSTLFNGYQPCVIMVMLLGSMF